MNYLINKHFKLGTYNTTFKNEFLAGITTFFTVAYIVIVNANILSYAGMSLHASVLATILTCSLSCILIGFWSNSPLVIIPGMGENIFFTYTIVSSLGLNWQEALAVVLFSGIIFTIVAFTSIPLALVKSIPDSLKYGITVGIGLFLTFIGLQKGGIIVDNSKNLIGLGDLTNASTLLTLGTLIVVAVLYFYNIKGGFLISIILSTIVSLLIGTSHISYSTNLESTFGEYPSIFAAFSFKQFFTINFWTGVLSLTLILLFQNLGTIQSLQSQNDKFRSSYQASGISNIFAGILGTSSTVVALESAAGIASGAKTGLSSVIAGIAFIFSLVFLPFINAIPASSIAPLLIIIGSFMLGNIKFINFNDFSDYFPSFLIIIMIPLSYNISDGMAFGFISYIIIKILCGKGKQLNVTILVVALLFLLNFILPLF